MATYPNLLNARSTNGSGTAQALARAKGVPREGTLFIFGTFGGATVTIEVSMDQTTWIAVPSGAFTAATVTQLQTSAHYIRATVTNVGTTSVSAHYE